MKKLIYLSLLLILICSNIFSSCGPVSSGKTPTTATSSITTSGKGILTMTNTDPYTLDPAASNEVLSASYIMQIFSGLLKLDKNLEPVPDIAENMPTLSSDGLSYIFHLRKDVKFQDGTAVTAADFKYSWERAANPATNSPTAATYLGDIVGVNDMLAGKANQISGVKVIDSYTLQITIDSPKSYFLYKLTYPSSFVVEKKNVNSGANWWLKPSGTGPFKVQEWVKNTDFILARNDLYYGDKANIAQVKMILNSTSSDMDLFETGQIDLASPGTVYSDKIMDPAEPFYQNLVIAQDLSLEYIGFNCKQAPFDDANVRKAFSLAIDKDTIISLTYRNMAQKAQGILPPGLPGYNSNLTGLDLNISQAQSLIKASKYGDVSNLPPIILTIAGAGGSADAITQAIVYQWKQNLGIDVQVRELEPEIYYANLAQEVDQMYSSGWIADYPHPQDFLDILFSSGSSYNYGGYANASVDSLIQQANRETDQAKSFTLYQQAEQQIVNDAACLPLSFSKTYLLIQPYIKNLIVSALGFLDFTKVTISPH